MSTLMNRKENFDQVVVWEGTTVGEKKVSDFESWVKDELDSRVQYLGEVKTLPDLYDNEGKTGVRNDLLFSVHKEDIPKFSVKRLQYGMRWLEDVFHNGNKHLYSEQVQALASW